MHRIVLGFLIGLYFSDAFATPPHETWFFKGIPTQEKISYWNDLPDSHSLIIQMQDPRAWDLAPLLNLKNTDRIQLEISRFPGHDTLSIWNQLARLNAELVALNAGLPSESEIITLNAIGFCRILFVLSQIPGINEATRLSKLISPHSITFVTGSFPKYIDKSSFMALSPDAPVLFRTDYWPRFAQMDILNLIPQTEQKLQIKGIWPTEKTFEYLLNMHALKELTIETDFDPPRPGPWAKFENITARWLSKDRIPSPTALIDFEQSLSLQNLSQKSRVLMIDRDEAFTSKELSLLVKSKLPVEWIHTAP
jgi:hypothetical protein